MQRLFIRILLIIILVFIAENAQAQIQKELSYEDVFQLEYTSNPQISPDGTMVVYRRMGFDIMNDRAKGDLWLVSADGSSHRKLTNREGNESQAQWSPSGDRIVYASTTEEGSEIFVYWMNSGSVFKLTQLEQTPSSLAWSPDGRSIAFSMKIEAKAPVLVNLPEKPKGAEWSKPARITDRLKHERDGSGYINPGFNHIFMIPSEGGTPRQLTHGDFNHGGPLSWTPNGRHIYFSANRNENWEYDFRNSEVYSVNVNTEIVSTHTTRNGPDHSPLVSPDGKTVAFLGYEDKVQAYQLSQLQLMDIDGNNKRALSGKLDRSIKNAIWASDSQGLYILYDDKGRTKIAYMDLNGNLEELVDNVGGTILGRPYSSGSFTLSDNGKIAYTISYPNRPADIAILQNRNAEPRVITGVNEELLAYRLLGRMEEIWYKSSVDGRDIQGWLIYPPTFTKKNKYPLIVENHGGPIMCYGAYFSTEVQLYAAAGYMVFYPNPRGSTGYGEEFGNLLYHNYPGEDYNDIMDGVNAVIEKGKVDKDKLFVTGGSAGGIMTAWIIGKTNRFKAAVVAKPVMNWISKTLTADNYYGYANSRYPGHPWENFEDYWKFSPISLVGNVETPTMVMVGLNDLRTPPSEAKQLYHALKLRKIETVLVEMPDVSHGIASRPSNLISKVAHILAWFDKYNKD